MDSISCMIRNALIASWNKASGMEPTEKQLGIEENEDELIELQLL